MGPSFLSILYLVVVVVAKLCLTLCDPMDCSTPGFPVLPLFFTVSQSLFKLMSSKWWCYLTISSSATATAKSLQSCPTLCDPIDGSPPGSPVPGILQARTLEWVAISSSNAWKWKVKVKSLSRFRLLATPWTTAHQAPPSMGFSRQEYWSGVPSHPLLLPFPPALNLSQHQDFFQWVSSSNQVPKVLELQHQSFQWIFRVDFLFHSPLWPSSRGCLVPLCFLPLNLYHLHIWDCWYFSQQSWFQLVTHPTWHFSWFTLHRI